MKLDPMKFGQLILFVFFIVIVPSSFSNSRSVPSTPNTWLPTQCFHSGEFIQTQTFVGLDKPLVSNGRYLYSCKMGLIWVNEHPVKEQLIYRQSGQSVSLSDTGVAVELDGRADRAIASMLTGIMGNQQSYLEKLFNIEENEGQLELVPKRKRMKKYVEKMTLSKVNALPVTSLYFSSGDVLRFNFSNLESYESLGSFSCKETHLPHDVCDLAFDDIQK